MGWVKTRCKQGNCFHALLMVSIMQQITVQTFSTVSDSVNGSICPGRLNCFNEILRVLAGLSGGRACEGLYEALGSLVTSVGY